MSKPFLYRSHSSGLGETQGGFCEYENEVSGSTKAEPVASISATISSSRGVCSLAVN
jgi:hypothetical protein